MKLLIELKREEVTRGCNIGQLVKAQKFFFTKEHETVSNAECGYRTDRYQRVARATFLADMIIRPILKYIVFPNS